MSEEKINIKVSLKDEASKGINSIGKGFDSLKNKAKLLAVAGIGALAVIIKKSVDAFAEEEQASGTHLKDLMGKALIKEALKGNVAAIKEFGDRIDGKPKQTIDVNDTSIDDIINDL
jgi:hypothetical protein